MTPAPLSAHHGRAVRRARSMPAASAPASRSVRREECRRAWRAERAAARLALRAAAGVTP